MIDNPYLNSKIDPVFGKKVTVPATMVTNDGIQKRAQFSIAMYAKKYPRTLHSHLSLGTTSDDRFLPGNYAAAFAEMDELVLTEKLDGQNNCLNKHGVFARTHATPSWHPWDQPLRDRWSLLKGDLGELEIFGENMYAVHSIAYRKLTSYFYVFAIRQGDRWLSWEEVKFYAAALDFPTVPELSIQGMLRSYYDPRTDRYDLAHWLTDQLGGLSWTDSINTSGRLGGYDPTTGHAASEGFVLRNAAAFHANGGVLPVAANEFNNVLKLVRPGHVKTDVHWTKNWRAAQLTDYYRYGWAAHQYLGTPGKAE